MNGGAATPGSKRGRRKRGCTKGIVRKSKPHCNEPCRLHQIQPFKQHYEFCSKKANAGAANKRGQEQRATKLVSNASQYLKRLDYVACERHFHACILGITAVCPLSQGHTACFPSHSLLFKQTTPALA